MNWVEFYLGLAYAVGNKSKDVSKHGCIITNKKNKPLGFGYNGYPEGWRDDRMPTHREYDIHLAPNKYDVTPHAEVNAITNCNKKPKKAIAYVSGICCGNCMIHLYQNGVRKIYMLDKTCHMLSDQRSKKVFDFIEEEVKHSKCGNMEIYRVKPNLLWLENLGEEVKKLRLDGVLLGAGE